MDKQFIISIGREYGSGGHVIAEALAKHFKIPLYDRNFLSEMEKDSDISYDAYKKYEEKPVNPLLGRSVRGQSNSVERVIAEMQFEFLRSKAAAGESFVVVGRCAEDVLKDYPGLISIFLVGDIEVRKERIMELHNLSATKALAKLRRHDRSRKLYHNSHATGKWGDPKRYDICINSSRLGIDGTKKELLHYIETRIKHM